MLLKQRCIAVPVPAAAIATAATRRRRRRRQLRPLSAFYFQQKFVKHKANRDAITWPYYRIYIISTQTCMYINTIYINVYI